MLILTLRTDSPEAEIGIYDNQTQMDYIKWPAGRELSIAMHAKIENLLAAQGKELKNLQGIVCFQGPGSFTGLRIGLTVANALAYSLEIPIAATMDEDWIAKGVEQLQSGQDDQIALPHYGAPVHITQQKK